jgi:hypothetical protein
VAVDVQNACVNASAAVVDALGGVDGQGVTDHQGVCQIDKQRCSGAGAAVAYPTMNWLSHLAK